MSVHLIKLAVHISDVDHLARRQQQRIEASRDSGESGVLRHVTRAMPRRAGELLEGGSIYWVIRRAVRVRQRILALDPVMGEDGRRRCALSLDPKLVPVEVRPWRPFQGWRYLEAIDAPPDVSGDDLDDMPETMKMELRHLGLL